jgi:hypothetical protein
MAVEMIIEPPLKFARLIRPQGELRRKQAYCNKRWTAATATHRISQLT